MLVSMPPKGGTLAAADAVGIGRREAFGVRQLAAAFFLCTNNEPVTLFMSTPRWRPVTLFVSLMDVRGR
ncbi:MAG TPA: hypothetical protein PLW35_09040 [Verrucomicrobiota bacterium]|nr:hypothetical protein [Verrucomicrobiota bacterium]HOK77852.1 hypothetical protein [Verrucomicrobiota bacterium]